MTAWFEWSEAQPTSTYTIEPTSAISIELDDAFPVRPAVVTLRDATHSPSIAKVDELFGPDFSTILTNPPPIGLCAMQLVLYKSQRHAIADMQMGAKVSPRQLRHACALILHSAMPR